MSRTRAAFKPPEEVTVALIKPEGLTELQSMRLRMARLGLRIIAKREVLWDESTADSTLQKLYPDAPRPMLDAARDHFTGRVTPVLLIRGRNAIQVVRQLVGLHADPRQCKSYHLRHAYAELEPVPIKDGWYFRNGVHRCDTEEEATRLFNLFFVY